MLGSWFETLWASLPATPEAKSELVANFRNKATHKDRDTRYNHLMKRIIKSGVKTKVLMLSATPVNNRLADLKNPRSRRRPSHRTGRARAAPA